MKKLLIMGDQSFTGKNLKNYFKNKYDVTGISRMDFDFLDEHAVTSYFSKNFFDVIINCSAQNVQRKIDSNFSQNDILGNNLKMFFNLENCLNSETKLINFGSGAQYNKHQDLIKVTESEIGVKLPDDDYGYSKYVISKYIRESNHDNIINAIIFGLYGSGEDYTFKFISNAIVKNLLQLPIIINQNVIFDYLYIEDFLRIVEYIIENDMIYKEFNLTPTISIDLYSIAKIINEISNFKSEIMILNPGKNYQYTGSNKLLMENLNHSFTFTNYIDGIKNLYQYYKQNISQLDTKFIYQDLTIKKCVIKRK